MKFMTAILYVLFAFSAQFVFSSPQSEGKIYVDLNDLILDENGIRINLNNGFMQLETSSLHFDANSGYYVAYSEQPWRCPRCGKTNPTGVSICQRCGWPD